MKSGVNFINISCTSFWYESALISFSLVMFWLCNFLAKKSFVKCWWKWHQDQPRPHTIKEILKWRSKRNSLLLFKKTSNKDENATAYLKIFDTVSDCSAFTIQIVFPLLISLCDCPILFFWKENLLSQLKKIRSIFNFNNRIKSRISRPIVE